MPGKISGRTQHTELAFKNVDAEVKKGPKEEKKTKSKRVTKDVKPSRAKDMAPKLQKEIIPKLGKMSKMESSFSDSVRHTNAAEMPGGSDWLNEYDNRASIQIHATQQGQKMQEVYTYHGEEVAREVADRTDVVSILKQSHMDRIAHLETRLQELKGTGNSEMIQTLSRQLELTRANLTEVDKAQENGQTWAASGSYRRLLENVETKEEAHEKYMPTCVNLRTQKVIEGILETSAINRSGAISDYRHGATNLKEMQELRETLDTMNSISDMTPAQQNLARVIVPGFSVDGTLDELIGALDQAITDRSWVLENQALQDLTAHFAGMQDRAGDIVGRDLGLWVNDQDTVTLGRVSMLDGIKPPIDDGSFVLNEKNQMLDMEAIYETLQGKQLVFDGRGPFLDDEGKVHLPFKLKDANGDPVVKKLDVVYFNISAQGNIKNEGPQLAINARAMELLYDKVDKRCNELVAEGRLNDADALSGRMRTLEKYLAEGPEDGFDTAEEAAMLLVDCGSLLSINCFSGKDRTGLLAELITNNRLKSVARDLELKGNSRKALMARWGRQAMGREGLACRIVADNTGHKALKLSVPRVRLLVGGRVADYLMGIKTRIEMLGNATATFISKAGQTGEAQLWDMAA